MSKFQLLYFFWELLKLSEKYPGKPGWGRPCSQLLEAMCLRQETFIDRILGDHTNSSNEYRLNEAGLKMYWIVERKNQMLTDSPDDNCGPVQSAKFKCYIGGDQAKDYEEFVLFANHEINKRGMDKRRR